MAEACEAFGTPITGGNVSLYNETLREPVRPSPVMGIVGLMKTAQPVPADFRESGLTVMLLGGLGDCEHRRFGGTQYAKVVLDDFDAEVRRLCNAETAGSVERANCGAML